MAAVPVVCQFLVVTGIEIEGNKRTKDEIILRELQFTIGDRIQQSQLATVLRENEFNLLSSTLFTQANLNVKEWDVEQREIVILITVKEGPIIVPIPIFELADRNFNVWWTEQKRSLKRVNYGLKLALLNPWGYGERFRLTAQFGYTPKFEFSSLLPFLDNNQTVRLELRASYSTNKEVSAFNEDNKKIFRRAEDEPIIFKRQHYMVGLIFRPKIFATHVFRVGYRNHWIDEQFMLEQNTDFFLESRSRQQFIYADYEFRYDKRDLPILSTEGWQVGLRFFKDGFGLFDDISATYIEPSFEYHYPIKPKLVASGSVRGKVGLERGKQPYYNYRGLGYSDNTVRGYELYVADALDFFITKVSLKYRVWESMLKWSNFLPIQDMPFQVWLAANFDAGNTNDPFYNENNDFTNRWLYGGGLGLNLLFYNTILFRVECSVNHLGEKGVFLHSETAF